MVTPLRGGVDHAASNIRKLILTGECGNAARIGGLVKRPGLFPSVTMAMGKQTTLAVLPGSRIYKVQNHPYDHLSSPEH